MLWLFVSPIAAAKPPGDLVGSANIDDGYRLVTAHPLRVNVTVESGNFTSPQRSRRRRRRSSPQLLRSVCGDARPAKAANSPRQAQVERARSVSATQRTFTAAWLLVTGGVSAPACRRFLRELSKGQQQPSASAIVHASAGGDHAPSSPSHEAATIGLVQTRRFSGWQQVGCPGGCW
jgi:hypothetical protein